MEILWVIGGVILGIIITKIIDRKSVEYGVIDVEEETGLCRFRISDNRLVDKRVKRAVFSVNHNVYISRDEQGL